MYNKRVKNMGICFSELDSKCHDNDNNLKNILYESLLINDRARYDDIEDVFLKRSMDCYEYRVYKSLTFYSTIDVCYNCRGQKLIVNGVPNIVCEPFANWIERVQKACHHPFTVLITPVDIYVEGEHCNHKIVISFVHPVLPNDRD